VFREQAHTNSENLRRLLEHFVAWWRAPQQMLRTHRSLKASCATPVMKMSSFLYQVLQLMEHQWNEIDRGKPTTRRKTCLRATLPTTNLTWTDPGSNPGLRGERPATNRLSHGTAHSRTLSFAPHLPETNAVAIFCDELKFWKWLDVRRIVFRCPARATFLSLLRSVFTGTGAHPASYPMGIFPPGKSVRAWNWPLTSV
jgi:hypothetical protein